MQLKGNLRHPMGLGELHLLLPVGNQHLVPLVLQNLAEVIRPGAGDPVGRPVLFASAGASREGVHHGHMQLLRQQYGIVEILLEALRDGGVGMYHVAVAAQGADFQMVLVQRLHELLPLPLVGQKLRRVAVGLAGEAAAADLHHLHAPLRQELTRLVKGQVSQRYRQCS